MSRGRIVVVGGSGTIGSAVVRELGGDHDVLSIGRSTDPRIDLGDLASIETLVKRLESGPRFDAIVVCAGGGLLGRVDDLDLDDALDRLRPKLIGQIAVAQAGPRFLREGGAVVLTGGILERRPQPGMSHLAMINAALRAFAGAAATEGRSVRTCVVSPGLVAESPPAVLDLFPGMPMVSGADLAQVYRRLIESTLHTHLSPCNELEAVVLGICLLAKSVSDECYTLQSVSNPSEPVGGEGQPAVPESKYGRLEA